MKGLYIYDTESNGLAGKSIAPEDRMDKFHCMLFKEYKLDNWVLFLDKNHPEYEVAEAFVETKNANVTIYDITELDNWLANNPKAIACQNQYGFDLKAFAETLGFTYSMFPETINGYPIKLYDTLSMSRTLWPDRMLPKGCPSKVKNPLGGPAKTIGPHSLEAWGYKLANQKVAIEDWRGLMIWKYVDRVWTDVEINELQWEALVKEMVDGKEKGVDWRKALRNTMLSDYLMAEQEEQGVVFNEAEAWKLLERIDIWMKEIANEVEPKLPLKDVPKSRQPTFPKEPFSGDGSISHYGWNYAKNILGYTLNDEYFNLVSPPKTAFKKDGELSKAGENYCIKQGMEDKDKMPDFIRSQREKVVVCKPLEDSEFDKLREQLRSKFMPSSFLKETMKLSNQEDIKDWLVKEGGWKPTIFNTKDVTRDDRKQQRKDPEVEQSVWEWIQDKRESLYEPFLSQEIGFRIKNISSRNHKDFKKAVRKARFLVTSPKLKDERGNLCPNLDRIEGEMAKNIVKWLSLRNRRSVIKSADEKKTTGWLNHPRLKVDGKLPARYSGRTNTFRLKHSVIANIPSGDALLGHEMRSLFTVPEGHMQLGCDASNMENIIAAWWAWTFGKDGGEYYKVVSVGDPHSTNAAAYSIVAGREVGRGEGKGITYAILYGAGAAKVAVMLGVSVEVGKEAIAAFWDSNLGLKRTKEYLEKQWEGSGKKYIIGIDGRKVMARSKSSLLNLALQSTGAIMMCLAGIKYKEKALKEKMEDKGVFRTIYYHDEYQLQVPDNQIRFKWFDSGSSDSKFVNSVLKKHKGLVKDKSFTGFDQLAELVDSSENVVERIVTSFKDAEDYRDTFNENPESKFTLAAKVKEKNGKFGVGYCRAGELLIESIEEATAELGAPVVISGEYMIAFPSEGWGGAH